MAGWRLKKIKIRIIKICFKSSMIKNKLFAVILCFLCTFEQWRYNMFVQTTETIENEKTTGKIGANTNKLYYSTIF